MKLPLAELAAFPSNLIKLRLVSPDFQEPRFGSLPSGLVSLAIDYNDGWDYDDDKYAFQEQDLTGLPSSLLELSVLSRKGIRLTGEWPENLKKITLSKSVSFESALTAILVFLVKRKKF
jgi:hypothetical protein